MDGCDWTNQLRRMRLKNRWSLEQELLFRKSITISSALNPSLSLSVSARDREDRPPHQTHPFLDIIFQIAASSSKSTHYSVRARDCGQVSDNCQISQRAEPLPRSIMSAAPDDRPEADQIHAAVVIEEEPEENPFIVIERKGSPHSLHASFSNPSLY